MNSTTTAPHHSIDRSNVRRRVQVRVPVAELGLNRKLRECEPDEVQAAIERWRAEWKRALKAKAKLVNQKLVDIPEERREKQLENVTRDDESIHDDEVSVDESPTCGMLSCDGNSTKRQSLECSQQSQDSSPEKGSWLLFLCRSRRRILKSEKRALESSRNQHQQQSETFQEECTSDHPHDNVPENDQLNSKVDQQHEAQDENAAEEEDDDESNHHYRRPRMLGRTRDVVTRVVSRFFHFRRINAAEDDLDGLSSLESSYNPVPSVVHVDPSFELFQLTEDDNEEEESQLSEVSGTMRIMYKRQLHAIGVTDAMISKMKEMGLVINARQPVAA